MKAVPSSPAPRRRICVESDILIVLVLVVDDDNNLVWMIAQWRRDGYIY